MEHKIGEIFEYNGEWYQCIKDTEYTSCINCCFYNGGHKLCIDKDIGNCVREYRSDAKSICFKKLEKVGEPYKFGRKLMQKYNIYAKPYLSDDYGYIYIPGRYNEVISIEIKQNKENMEEQHSTENYPKEDEVATRIANKVGEDIRDKLEKNLNKEDIEEKKQKLDDLVGLYSSAQITYKEFDKELKALYSCKEEIKPNLKEFDIEAAKQGKPVCTRDGRKARIVCFDAKCGISPIIALIENCNNEEVHKFHKDGKLFGLDENEESFNDLMMLPEKKEGWILLRKDGYMFDNEEVAKKNCTDEQFVAKVEWEE